MSPMVGCPVCGHLSAEGEYCPRCAGERPEQSQTERHLTAIGKLADHVAELEARAEAAERAADNLRGAVAALWSRLKANLSARVVSNVRVLLQVAHKVDPEELKP